MADIITRKETTTFIDADGTERTTSKESTTNYERNNEPDYIKLYTRMWCEFNEIPNAYRDLFLELVMRMSYCNSHDLDNSQIVFTGEPVASSIMNTLKWKKRMYQTGLKVLTECKAIKRVARGVYQINANYAGKGEWKYNPKYERGGVEDLVAKFNFKKGTVETEIVWADNGEDTELNEMFREGMGVKAKDQTVLKTTTKKPAQDSEGQSA